MVWGIVECRVIYRGSYCASKIGLGGWTLFGSLNCSIAWWPCEWWVKEGGCDCARGDGSVKEQLVAVVM